MSIITSDDLKDKLQPEDLLWFKDNIGSVNSADLKNAVGDIRGIVKAMRDLKLDLVQSGTGYERIVENGNKEYFNANNQLIKKENSSGDVLFTYTYADDSVGTVQTKTYKDVSNTSVSEVTKFDAEDKITSIKTPTYTSTYEYKADPSNYVITIKHVKGYAHYHHYTNGKLTKITSDVAVIYNHEYNSLNKIISTVDQGGKTSYEYKPDPFNKGGYVEIKNHNGILVLYKDVDKYGNIVYSRNFKDNVTIDCDIDAKGNIKSTVIKMTAKDTVTNNTFTVSDTLFKQTVDGITSEIPRDLTQP